MNAAVRATITGLTIQSGATFWIRWTDFNATGADDGLVVDDFSLVAQGSGGGASPTGVGTATPPIVNASPILPTITDTTLLTVRVTPGTAAVVIVDLSSLGLSAEQPMFDDGTHGDATAGDLTFSFTLTITALTPGGTRPLPVRIVDAAGRIGTSSIALTVLTPLLPGDRIHSGDRADVALRQHRRYPPPDIVTATTSFPMSSLVTDLRRAL